MTEDTDLLKVKDIVPILGVHKITVYRWISAGILPSIKISGRAIRVRRSDLDTFLASRRRATD